MRAEILVCVTAIHVEAKSAGVKDRESHEWFIDGTSALCEAPKEPVRDLTTGPLDSDIVMALESI